MDVTFSKQWIHFRRSDLCPPTSTILHRAVTSLFFSRPTPVLPKDDVLQIERIFDDACGWHSNSEHVLFCGEITGRGYSFDTIQITEERRGTSREEIAFDFHSLFRWIGQLIFSSSIVALFYSRITPKTFDGFDVGRFKGCHCFIVDWSNKCRVFVLDERGEENGRLESNAVVRLAPTSFCLSPYFIVSVSMARVIICIAMNMFW